MKVEERRCELCRYWQMDDGEEADEGQCHRYPPVSSIVKDAWVFTYGSEWCGEFKA